MKDLQLLCGDEDNKPVVIVDGGIATQKNLEFLRTNGFDYIVNGKRTTRKIFAEDFYKKDAFEKISGRDGKIKKHIYIRKLEKDNEHIILCCSEERKKKEDDIWKIYITLTKVEDAFRLLKSDLGLRPFYHHTENRCEGHVWITILAYHLLRWIEYTMKFNVQFYSFAFQLGKFL
ncbi:MAG: transposase [Victivallaceae bacterium]|nr:transposase [Victivallaceae bacterium]